MEVNVDFHIYFNLPVLYLSVSRLNDCFQVLPSCMMNFRLRAKHAEKLLCIKPRVHNFRGRGECPAVYTAAKHTALSYDAIRY